MSRVSSIRGRFLDEYKRTGLWAKTLGPQAEEAENETLSALRATYGVFRTRAAALTAQIAKAVPGLTMHDITHLDALWETADLIAGKDYPLNPAEAFVLGGAILMHDAALCFEAYEGGQAGLRRTIVWQDIFASLQAKDPLKPELDNFNEADFAAMRHLHAKRASELAAASWTTPEGDKLYLIENHEIRIHYGKVIGDIAASHHWPIENLVLDLPPQISALSSMPREWRVDPIKIACLLRCADAAHVDSRRAPDFLRALAVMHGVSAHHWTAQNWLERVDVDASDPTQSSLIFTSGKPFDEEHADAWWVAFDAVRLVDKELQSCAHLLSARNQSSNSPPFQMVRVTGASSPLIASKSIRTIGWTPQAVEIHVGNLEKLIAQLGGEKLYGESQTLIIVLRELIQNSRDSIAARRFIDNDYGGRVRVSISDPGEEACLTVEDDGVGMSYRVITGPLLDFGASFWATDLVRSEFPSLLSKGYKSVGKFGIGFYSVFMVASSVTIASRMFRNGFDKITQIKFPKGLSLRPIISTDTPADFGYSASTKVHIKLSSKFVDPNEVEVFPGRAGYEPRVAVTMKQCIAILCAGLDVPVELKVGNSNPELAHAPISYLDDQKKREEWMLGILGAESIADVDVVLADHIGRLRPIHSDGMTFGMAALCTAQSNAVKEFGSISTVGGLATSIVQSDLSRFVGMIDYHANTAKRDASPDPVASKPALEAWGAEQKLLLPSRETDPMAWLVATGSLADLSLDPIDIATFLVRSGDQFLVLPLEELVKLIASHGLAIYKSHMMEHIEMHHSLGSFPNYPTLWPIKNSGLLSFQRNDRGELNVNSFLSCILRKAEQMNIVVSETILPNVAVSHFGPISVLLLRGKAPSPSVSVNVNFETKRP